jgi:hypothetical protein
MLFPEHLYVFKEEIGIEPGLRQLCKSEGLRTFLDLSEDGKLRGRLPLDKNTAVLPLHLQKTGSQIEGALTPLQYVAVVLGMQIVHIEYTVFIDPDTFDLNEILLILPFIEVQGIVYSGRFDTAADVG